MENFDLKAWMKANKQGPYKMFEQFEGKKNKKKLNEGIGGYVDMRPVNEADSMIFDKGWQYEDNDWMQDVDGTEAYKVGDWTCYYEDNLGALEWTYKDDDPYGVVVYATPNFHDDGKTPIEVSREGEILANYEIDQAFFDSFEEYAKAVRPYLEDIQRGFDIEDSLRGSVNELEKPKNIYANDEDSYLNRDQRVMDLGGKQIKTGIENLLNQGYEQDEVQEFYSSLIEGDLYDEDDFEEFLKDQTLVKNGIDSLMDDGFDPEDIKELCDSFVSEWETSSGDTMNELEKPENIYSREEDDSVKYDRIMDLGGEQIEQGIISLMDEMFEPADILELVKELLKNRVEMEKNYGKLEEDEIKDHNKLMKLGGNMLYKSIVTLIENGVSTETIIKMVPKLIKQYKNF